MSDRFERELEDMLRERAAGDPESISKLADGIDDLPNRGRPGIGWIVAIAIAVTAAVAIGAPRPNDTGSTPSPTPRASGLPGGPEAFAGDPRLAQCFGRPEDMEFVFELARARDYRLYLPAMGLSPELDVDTPALAVIYERDWEAPTFGGAPGAPQTTPASGTRHLCVVVTGSAPNLYSGVDITGLTLVVTPTGPPAVPTDPATEIPAWVLDIAGQLECAGPVPRMGGEYGELGVEVAGGASPQEALATFLGPSNPFALPADGYTPLQGEAHWASFGHIYGGPKAIIVLNDRTERGPGWAVVALRACDASEFDPSIPLTFPVTIWTDVSGDPVSTELVHSNPGPGHCGWESAIWLRVGDDLFFRDPDGVMAEFTSTTFEVGGTVPPTAVDTGYLSNGHHLWIDPGGDAYLVPTETAFKPTERWPRALDPFMGCA